MARLSQYTHHINQGLVKRSKHTATSIRWWSPTQLLIGRSEACLWQSGRDADYSSVYGRMCWELTYYNIYS